MFKLFYKHAIINQSLRPEQSLVDLSFTFKIIQENSPLACDDLEAASLALYIILLYSVRYFYLKKHTLL